MANQEREPFVLDFPNGQRVEDILKKADQLPTKAQLDQQLSSKATMSDVERETQNLQNQINEIVRAPESGGDVAAEVAQARVADDGASYNTLKERLDSESDAINAVFDYFTITVTSTTGPGVIDRQFIEKDFKKGRTYGIIVNVGRDYTLDGDFVVLNIRTASSNEASSVVDDVSGEIRQLLTKGKYIFTFTATANASYLYIYISAYQQPVILGLSVTEKIADLIDSSVENRIAELDEYLSESIGVVQYNNPIPDEIFRNYIPFNFISGRKYTLTFKFGAAYTNGHWNNIIFNARTSSDREPSSVIDQISGEIRKSLPSDELTYSFEASGNANYIYIYSAIAESSFVCDIRTIDGNIYENVEKYVDGKHGEYSYSGQRISLQKYAFDVNSVIHTTNPFTESWQGCSSYGDYLFRLVHTGKCAVYSIDSGGTAIATFNLGSYSAEDNHANCANFGSNRYDPNDEFPLLYVTDGNSPDVMRCAVERITRNGAVFLSEKVQTITLDQSGFAENGLETYWGWSMWLTADNAIYYFGCKYRSNGSERANDYKNRYVVTKFRIPDLEQEYVTLTAADVVEQWTSPYDTEITQGGCIYGDNLFYSFGYGTSEYPSIIKVFSLSEKSSIATIPLDGSSLGTVELEDLTVSNGRLLVANSGNTIYEIDFK